MAKNKGKHGGRWKEIFEYFGIKKGDRAAIRKSLPEGATAKTLFQTLKKDTGKSKGTGFLEWASSKPEMFKKATKKYNLKTGTPSLAQEEIAKKEAEQAAEESIATDKGISSDYLAEQERRIAEGYDVNAADTKTQYDRFVEDLATQGATGQRKYADQLSNDELQALLETQTTTGDINAAGQWNSSLKDTRLAQLGQQQSSRSANIKDTYQDYLNSMSNLGSRQAADYSTTIQKYQRQKDQGLFDLDLLERQRESDFSKSTESYATDYLSNYNQGIAEDSQDYYDRQNATDQDAANFTQDLYNVGN